MNDSRAKRFCAKSSTGATAKITHRTRLETSFEDAHRITPAVTNRAQGGERQSLVADQVSADPASSSSEQSNAG